MAFNAANEMRWVDAWETLHGLVGERLNAPCQLPDRSIVDVDRCKEWLQSSIYQRYLVQAASGWVGHKRGVPVSLLRADESMKNT
jgi:hypothetical protein